jgi:hypothetical protein
LSTSATQQNHNECESSSNAVGNVLSASLLAGCGKNNQTQSAKAPSPALSSERTALEQSIAAWTSGDKAGAVSQFLQIDWTKGKPFSSGSILHYSEAEFAALPPETRAKLSDQMADITALKELARQVSQQGQQAAAKGDKAEGAKYFNALNQCGERLEQPDCLLLLQQVGKAFKKLAAKEGGAGK